MILENVNNEHIEVTDLPASPDYLGEGFELADIQLDAMTEMHNLTIALARVEHKCLVEGTDESKTFHEGAIGEFFKRQAENIKTWWRKFVAWLGSLVTRLKDAFVKREEWLNRNKAVLNGLTDEQLKDIKVSIGTEVAGADFIGALKGGISEAEKLINVATTMDGVQADKSKTEQLKGAISSFFGGKATDSVAAAINGKLVGDSKEVDLNKALVGKLVASAEKSYKAILILPSAKAVADAAVKSAAGLEGMTAADDGKEKAAARVAAMNAVAPKVQQMFAALASAIGAANGQAMSALVKAASKAGKKEEKPAAKQEESSILAAFM